MSTKVDKDNKSFCLAPWMSIHTWPDGRTFPCCLWDSEKPIGNINRSPLEEIWNNGKMKEARVSMMKGERIDACERCYHLEDTNYGSYRQDINERHADKMHYVEQTKEDGTLEEMNLHLWDLRLSNFCNFKCRSCGAGLSSTWFSDTKALAKNEKLGAIGNSYYNNPHGDKALITVNDKVSFLDMISPHYSCVDEVYFAGGEPLMMPEHYTILDKLIELDRTDVMIRYSTNFSTLKFGKKDVLEYWKIFKNMQLWISIDGVGEIGEYIRSGYNDKKFEENINTFKASGIKPPDIGYMVTYGVMNYLHLFDMVIDFIRRGFVDYKKPFYGNKLMHFSPISFPKYYDCMFMPDKFKKQFYDRLVNFHEELAIEGASEFFINDIIPKLGSVYNRSLTNSFDHQQMLECKVVNEELDILRKEKFNEVFPYFPTPESFTDNSETYELEEHVYSKIILPKKDI